MNPLENLVSLRGVQLLDSSSTAEQQMNPPTGANSPTPSPRPRTSPRGNKKWVESVCGSGLASALRVQHSPENAARERSRVRNLRQAFHSLQAALPSVPPDTKLSKLDVLVLATNYIAYLTETLDQGGTHAEHAPPPRPGGYLHPVKKWPMRSLLYCGSIGELLSANQRARSGQEGPRPQPVFTDAEKP
ncbi:transcription factor 23 [Oryzias melastigma]|uniref:Transcription factor 23-like n=1 Tax=Oryzias melastigma TaxID=30732 RepID=A0A3B3DVC2_ORYME|nr:transcription factor 23 [Oryzias melastigma]